MLSSLNLNLLRSLDALLETRNLTQAAQRLALTQSALSRHLAQLRQQLEDPLLLRQGPGYVLTERAAGLRLPLKAVLADIEALYQAPRFDPGSCSRRFEFAGSDYLAEYMLPEMVARMLPQAPNLQLVFRLWQPGHYEILAEQGVDLVATIAEAIPENLHGRDLGSDQPVCVMRRDHPLAGAPCLSLDDYLAWPHVRISGGSDKDSFVERLLAQDGRRRDVRLSVPFFVSALRIIAGSDLLLTTPVHLAAKLSEHFPVTWRALPFAEHTYRYWLLWHARLERDAAHQWFRNHVFDVLHHSIYGVHHYDKSS